jgi:HSP20 family protein
MTTVTEPVAPLLRDLNRLFAGRGSDEIIPRADVLVTEEEVTVHMDVPGVHRDQVEIELVNDTLTVRGERPYPYGDEQRYTWLRLERGFGRFERELRVPPGLDPAAVEAALTEGVLSLSIPKPETLKPHRIEIKEGAGQPALGHGAA